MRHFSDTSEAHLRRSSIAEALGSKTVSTGELVDVLDKQIDLPRFRQLSRESKMRTVIRDLHALEKTKQARVEKGLWTNAGNKKAESHSYRVWFKASTRVILFVAGLAAMILLIPEILPVFFSLLSVSVNVGIALSSSLVLEVIGLLLVMMLLFAAARIEIRPLAEFLQIFRRE